MSLTHCQRCGQWLPSSLNGSSCKCTEDDLQNEIAKTNNKLLDLHHAIGWALQYAKENCIEGVIDWLERSKKEERKKPVRAKQVRTKRSYEHVSQRQVPSRKRKG